MCIILPVFVYVQISSVQLFATTCTGLYLKTGLSFELLDEKNLLFAKTKYDYQNLVSW